MKPKAALQAAHWVTPRQRPIPMLLLHEEDLLIGTRLGWGLSDGDIYDCLDALAADAGYEFDGDELVIADRESEDEVRAVLEWIRQQFPPAIEVELQLDRTVDGHTETLLHAHGSLEHGVTQIFDDSERRRGIVDYEIEVSQDIGAANPIVSDTVHGTSVAARVQFVGTGERTLLLELLTNHLADAPTHLERPTRKGFASLNWPVMRLANLTTSALLSNGRQNEIQWTADDGAVFRMRFVGRWEKRAEPPKRPGIAIQFGAFSATSANLSVPPRQSAEDLHWSSQWMSRDNEEYVHPDYGVEGAHRLFLGENAHLLARTEANNLEARFQQAHVEFTCLDVATGASADDGRVIASFSGPIVVGVGNRVCGQRDVLGLVDYDVEVGRHIRYLDPRVHSQHIGNDVYLRCLPGSSNKVVRALEIQAYLERISGFRTRDVTIDFGKPTDAQVEHLRVRQTSVNTTLRLDKNGRAETRRSANRLLGPGRDLLVLVQVRAPE